MINEKQEMRRIVASVGANNGQCDVLLESVYQRIGVRIVMSKPWPALTRIEVQTLASILKGLADNWPESED